LSHYSRPTNALTFNIAYYPNQRAAYNFDVSITEFSRGIDSLGQLVTPETRWGGVQEHLTYNIYKIDKIKYLAFWLMDPFVYNPESVGGKLYINLGEISEDIYKDGFSACESNIGISYYYGKSDTTKFGIIGSYNNNSHAAYQFSSLFNNYQDVGLDGLSDVEEKSFFRHYRDSIASKFGYNSLAYINANNDPSADNHRNCFDTCYNGTNTDINYRYKKQNNYEGNSEFKPDLTYHSARNTPDYEDLNRDRKQNIDNHYYEIGLKLSPDELEVGKNYIIEKKTVIPDNGDGTAVDYYKFLIPTDQDLWTEFGIESIESISPFSIRIYLTEFKDSVILRFPEIAFVNEDLNKYKEIENSKSVEIYPNPCSGEIIKINTLGETINSLKIYNSAGKCVLSDDNNYINTEALSNGHYSVVIETSGGIFYKKLSVIKAQ